MKINDVIRTRRQALGLTQEALAERLGVSGPAVNKWEKSLNYPDITLLPTLARVLGVDLNTLLSFQEDMDRGEIGTSPSPGCRACAWPRCWRRRSCGSFPAMTIWPSAPPGCWRGF